MQNKCFKLMLCVIMNSYIIINGLSITITSPQNGSNINVKQPVISGTVFPNIGVNLTIDGVLSQEGNRTTPNKWNIKSSTVLSKGSHTAVATATINGQTVKAISKFTVNNAISNSVTINTPKNGSTVTTPLLIQGTAQPGSKLVIQVINSATGQTSIGNLTVGSTGFYSFSPAQVRLGQNVVRVTATSLVGLISTASASFILTSAGNTTSSCGCN